MPVSQVFSDEMWTEFKALMVAQGWDVEATEALWASDFSKVRQRQARSAVPGRLAPRSALPLTTPGSGQRKIISGFMKDAALGEKRFASMPDRAPAGFQRPSPCCSRTPRPIGLPRPSEGSGAPTQLRAPPQQLGSWPWPP